MAHSADNVYFLQTVPQGHLEEYWNMMYTASYIANNPSRFLNTDWVQVPELCDFLLRKVNEVASIDPSGRASLVPTHVKTEPGVDTLLTRTGTVVEDGKETIEILSDSEEEMEANKIASDWVPHKKTAYIINLSDCKFNIQGDNGKLLSVDTHIKNKNQDSWTGGSGEGNSKVQFDIFTGSKIPGCRSHLECLGFHACPNIDPKLLDVEQYKLDPASLDTVVEAQIQTQVTEANSAENLILVFWSVIYAKPCAAQDKDGAQCGGDPMMKAYWKLWQDADQIWTWRKSYFIACSGWTKN
ncbi:hypothetical protein B0H34DRAFT_678970 [Crassisporium funariophilum]|nr:hypothetical protein B0H34DRAFT_678970 [Crassisporium funariophilum]